MAGQAQAIGRGRAGKWRKIGWSVAALIVLSPAVAMLFTGRGTWDGSDILVMACLVGGIGLVFELVVRITDSLAYRSGMGVALLTVFLLLWMSGAVGNEADPGNLIHAAVAGVAIFGALAARFRSAGMSRTMIGAAVAQATVAILAATGILSVGAGLAEVLFLTIFFGGLWLLSALLFREAALERVIARPAK